MAFQVRLLGAPELVTDGGTVSPRATKVTALLYHLAARGGWVEREELAALLWADETEDVARANLRKVVHRARLLPYAGDLEADRSRVRWGVRTDVAELEEALAANDAPRIVSTYRGPLLAGFHLDAAPEYEAWIEDERERLRRAWHATLAAKAAELRADRPSESLALLRALLADDPLDEDVMQTYLETARGGAERTRALQTFERFRVLLHDEMGLAPLDATVELAARLRAEQAGPDAAAGPERDAGGVDPSRAGPHLAAPASTAPPERPQDATPFIDRPDDLARVDAALDRPECRMLTLVGPGGNGKTRLALRVAEQRAPRYRDGVRIAMLSAVDDRAGLVDRVAHAVGIDPTAPNLASRLEAYLHDVRLLLVLDNFEQLADEALWLAELLRSAPGLQLLVTSRESLELREEWIHTVDGLAYPTGDALAPEGMGAADDACTPEWPAVTLFRRTAIRHGVTPGPNDLPAIVRVCRRVEGMPLAIEMAASWVRALSIDDVARELEADPGFLAVETRDTPERHRSMETVFAHSWRRLDAAQQSALASLAVFRGRFDRADAEAVAGASLRSLLSLVSKSLLRRHQDGRYDFHPLIHQFATRQLDLRPEDEARLHEKHGTHFLSKLHHLDALRKSGHTREFLDGTERDYPDLRAMWQWAIHNRRAHELERMVGSVEHFFVQRSRFDEGIAAFDEALASLDERDARHHPAIGRLLLSRGWMRTRRGEYEAGRTDADRAVAILTPLGPRGSLCESVNLQGVLAGVMGAYDEAKGHFEHALVMAEALGEEALASYCLNNLAITEKNLRNHARAEELYRKSLGIARKHGESASMARNLNNLGLLLYTRGDAEGARACFEEGLALAEAVGLQEPEVHLRSSLGTLALEAGRFDEARDLFERALARVRETKLRGVEAELLADLGMLAAERDDPDATRLLREGLELARATKSAPTCLAIVYRVATLWAKQGRTDESVRLLHVVLRHPATADGTRTRAERLAEALRAPHDETAGETPKSVLDEVLDQLIHEL